MSTGEARDWAAFIRDNTEALAPPLVPELRLHLAAESLTIWQLTEDELAERNVPPPYWAFAWAGGQALARFVLDNPARVAGRDVLDLGSGSGLTAIAARRAGARRVVAADIDPISCTAARLNAGLNGTEIEIIAEDLLAAHSATALVPEPGVVLVGDLFYERELAVRVLGFIERRQAAGACVLAGDPQRSYFPRERFELVAEYSVPVSRELEDNEIKRTCVWSLRR